MLSDVKTTMALERTCSAACLILRSSTAEITWRHLRLAAGLETKYPAWSDRQFLRFAFRRLCVRPIPSERCQSKWLVELRVFVVLRIRRRDFLDVRYDLVW